MHHEKLPNFSRINLHSNDLANNRFINNVRKEITYETLKNQYRSKRQHQAKLQELQNALFDLEPNEWTHLTRLVEERVSKITAQVEVTHRKKLQALGIEEYMVVNSNNIIVRKKKPTVESENTNCIFNYSTRRLSTLETNVLKKGLKFGIKNKKIDTYEIISRFEELAQSLNWLEINPAISSDPLKANLNNKSTFLQQLQQMTYEFLELSKSSFDILSDEEHAALKALAQDKSIVIIKADKGNTVVIQDIEVYRRKLLTLLEQDGKFKKLNSDETLLRERRLQDYLRSLTKVERSNKLSDTDYHRILPCGSKAGVLYGLPKIHKDNCPIRPIISAVGTYNYKLAKFLNEILSPLATNNNHTKVC